MKKIFALICIISLAFGQLGFAQTAQVAPFAEGKVFGLFELKGAIESADPARLREVAFSSVPPDASNLTKDLYYGALAYAALNISNMGKAEEIARQWIASNTGTLRPWQMLFEILWRATATKIEEAVTLGHELIAKDTKHAPGKINTRVKLAELYLSLGEYAKAEKLLKESEALLIDLRQMGVRGDMAVWAPYTRGKYFKVRCIEQIAQFQFKKAEESCLQSAGLLADAVNYKRMVSSVEQRDLESEQHSIQMLFAQIYVHQSRFYDAETMLKKSKALLATNGGESTERVGIFFSELELATARQDGAAIAALLQQRKELRQSTGTSNASTGSIQGRKRVVNALVVSNSWQAALTALDAGDKLIGDGDASMKRLDLNLVPRSLTYLMNNRAAQAVPLLEADLQKSSGYLGTDHPQTALLRGLLALSQASANPSNEASVLPELDRAVTVLTSSTAQMGDDFNRTDHPIALRMIFEKYIELAGNSANPLFSGRALGIADTLRSSSVQSAVNDAAVRASATTPALAELVRRDQDAKNELASLYNFISNRAGEVEAKRLESVMAQMKERIAELEKSRPALTANITKQFPEYSKLTNPTPPTIADIAAKLKQGEALVTLLPTDTAVYVWAISTNAQGAANQQFAKVDIDKPALTTLVKRLRASLDVAGLEPNRRPAFDHEAAQTLYAKLLSPVQQGLAGKTSLIIAAGGVLGQIPFGVLETAAAPRTVAMKDAPWLIKQAAITHVPSVAAWLSMRALPHKVAAQPMLAWGDPLFNLAMASTGKSTTGEVRQVVLTRASTSVDLEKEAPRSAIKYANIPSLPETRDELTAIAKALGADIAKDLILGSAATRASVLRESISGELAKRRVVVFATHGLMAGDLPNLTQPALAMAGTRDDVQNVLAPLLTLEDVLTLKLNADWVVLSACNTAAADGKAEEALSGLARGFFYAGSRSLLVTHWAVDSESAVTLTTETFKNYQSKPTEAKAESLRQAMLTVMANPATAHPTYWAPYALVGDGSR